MKYLYFCTDESLDSILKTQQIRRVEKNIRFSDDNYQILKDGNIIQAFVYDIEMISKSKCYITFPFDHLGKFEIRKWKLLFWFIPWKVRLLAHNLPKNGKAIVFEIRNEDDIEHHYMMDKQIKEKRYCESYSTKVLKIYNTEEIDFNDALSIIGIEYPYLSYPFQNWVQEGILISPDYKII